jgi:cell division protein FtsQ
MSKSIWTFIRRVVWVLVACSLGAGLYWGWWTLRQPTTYPIRQVHFIGTYTHVTPTALKAAALPFVSRGFFALDLGALWRQIEDMPWLYRAEIYRYWPATVSIRFQEQRAVARWGAYAVLNRQGELFTPNPETIPQQLPKFVADKKLAKSMWQGYQVYQKIVQKENFHISEVHVSAGGTWTLVLRCGLIVKLGWENQAKRLQHFMESCRGVFKSKLHAVESVDLRYPSGMAVKWRSAGKN